MRDGFLHVMSVVLGLEYQFIPSIVSNVLVTYNAFFFFFFCICICISISIVIVSCHWGSSWYEIDQIAIERILVERDSPCHISFWGDHQNSKNQLLKMFRLNKTHPNLNWARLFWKISIYIFAVISTANQASICDTYINENNTLKPKE